MTFGKYFNDGQKLCMQMIAPCKSFTLFPEVLNEYYQYIYAVAKNEFAAFQNFLDIFPGFAQENTFSTFLFIES